MNYLFPLTYLVNGLATTFLLIGLGLAGKSLLAADVGLVQGATLATFYAFSGNARSLILNASGERYLPGILAARLALALPLSAVSLILCVTVGGVGAALALALVLRRCAESFSEVQLSLLEREDRPIAALRHLIVQGVTLLIALVWALAEWDGWILIWFGWALYPLLAALPALRRFDWRDWGGLRRALPALFPHLGSTAIIGISIYSFRLLILLLGGRSLAGDLYTAFALGSFVGSVFANVLGPSLMWHEARTGQAQASWLDRLVLPALIGTGLCVLAFAFWSGDPLPLGRPQIFWQAVGLSLIGGAVMLVAQRLRLALLQEGAGVSVFGADMMINLLLLATIPFAFTLLGNNGLSAMHAVNALLCLVFYSSARNSLRTALRQMGVRRAALLATISGLLLAPVFVQLGGGVYRSAEPIFDSGGRLLNVPLPLSVAVTVAAIVFLGGYRRAQTGLSTLFVLFLLMLTATVVSTQGMLQDEQRKLVLFLQFLVPVLGLVLGQMVGAGSWRPIAAGFLVCLFVLVPAQLVSSWVHGEILLGHSVGLFAVYQHRQYVPVMLVAAYIMAWAVLRDDQRWNAAATRFSPLLVIYAVASTSVLAVLGLAAGVVLISRNSPVRTENRTALLGATLCGLGYFAMAIHSYDFYAKFVYQNAGGALLPDSFGARVQVWWDYFAAIGENLGTFVFGHSRPPERWVSTGAHNYYLDFIFHFGVLALLPLLYLGWHTAGRLWLTRRQLRHHPEVWLLAVVVGYLLVADNAWKVALRQPYSGILSFFLWGVLLARLERWRAPLASAAKLSPAVVSHAL